ncbi:hypothetical protein [Winogradskyella poriferorum]|uniref:hypothetical protein n=1 Tax=Winogradskyella poriferorum TaxID=307627 RepID=UPI003D6582BA
MSRKQIIIGIAVLLIISGISVMILSDNDISYKHLIGGGLIGGGIGLLRAVFRKNEIKKQ